jgi:hypothetical protein
LNLFVDLGRLVKIFQRLFINRARQLCVRYFRGQAAIICPNAQVKKGKVWLDGNRLFIFGNRQVILTQRFQHIGIDPIDIHILVRVGSFNRLINDGLGAIPLLGIDQNFGVVGQGKSVGIIQLLGGLRFLVSLK